MRLRAGFEIAYDCPAPVPMLLMLSVHPSRRGDLETPDVLRTDPALEVDQYVDTFGNVCSRLTAPVGRVTLSTDFLLWDRGEVDDFAPDAAQSVVEDLPPETLMYLLGSRYCETDRLSDIAWTLFEHTPPGWARVQAVVDWVHDHIAFDYACARPTKTAFDVYQEQVGVCRDYAHLAVAFCRCMNIPARYCTGYLTDIGVAPVAVMDFCAWFEVWLGGRWYAFDARNNEPRIGRVLIACGRDATDVAIATTFGVADLVAFKVMAYDLQDRSDGAIADR